MRLKGGHLGDSFVVGLNSEKHLRIKISEKSLTQRFDIVMTSFSRDKI